MEHNFIGYITIVVGGAITLTSVLVGGIMTYITTSKIDKNNRTVESKNLLNAIKSEIKTILIQIKEREYLTLLSDIIQEYPSQADLDNCIKENDKVPKLIIHKHDIYNIIFKTNVNKIGLIDGVSVTKIVQFYGIVEAILQDFIPTSPHNEFGMTKEILIQDIRLLVKVVELGHDIIGETVIDLNQIDYFFSYESNTESTV